ncbi:DUF222 domain-containing protein [Janibacter melonis]|uniref:DUF222 domain-containing protein n=1 Tax=Janibacter melonis TaxID=262209 RepID=A0A5P8FNP2_9MICO|nr:HNH endonuclease signature motif containing protein [Janibacter melonis]QFQ30801.2 DUF222 domain-containing protein [Janibacter melonis]
MFDDAMRFAEQARLGFGACAATAEVVGGSIATSDLAEMLVAVERARRAADAAELALLAELSRRERDPSGAGEIRLPDGATADFCGDEAAMTLDCSIAVADRRCRLAARLSSDLAALVAPLVAGEVPERTVQLVATETRDASPEAVAAVVAHVLAQKRGSEHSRLVALEHRELARACRRVLMNVDEGILERRAAQNRRDRTDVHLDPGPLGTSVVSAVLPTELAVVVYAAVEDLAARAVRDEPGLRLGAARAQAFVDLALRGVEVRTRLDLTVPVMTGACAGPDRTASAPTGGGEGGEPAGSVRGATPGMRPGGEDVRGVRLDGEDTRSVRLGGVEVPGAGWIPAEVVDAIRRSDDHELARVLLDADEGHVVASGQPQPGYVPRPGLRRLVQTRDGTCRMWGCTRPAVQCDLDHAQAWPLGETSSRNLGSLCRRHHRLKQHPRWGYELDAEGRATWTAPGGTSRVTWPRTWAVERPAPARRAPERSRPARSRPARARSEPWASELEPGAPETSPEPVTRQPTAPGASTPGTPAHEAPAGGRGDDELALASPPVPGADPPF